LKKILKEEENDHFKKQEPKIIPKIQSERIFYVFALQWFACV
jgi:hypothetical protein